jgi:nitrite reductase (NADH) small subunit/3-phenylpropionate/trans-cinnamate dioxygenase ferredoxin subunit
MDFADVGPVEAVPETGGLKVLVDGRAVALFRDRGAIVAFEDACPHAGAPLSAGVCRDGEVVCSWHGFRFDARTGVCPLYAGAPSATVRAVRVEQGRVLVAR